MFKDHAVPGIKTGSPVCKVYVLHSIQKLSAGFSLVTWEKMFLPSLTGLFQNTEIQCKIKSFILQVVDSSSIPSNTGSPNTLILFHFYLISTGASKSMKTNPYFISEFYFSNYYLQFCLPNYIFGPRSSRIYLPLLVIVLT